MGMFCPCKGTDHKSDFDKFGNGIVTYFKLLKSLIFCFLIICVLQIPCLVFYPLNSNSSGFSLIMTTLGFMKIRNINYYYKQVITVFQ